MSSPAGRSGPQRAASATAAGSAWQPHIVALVCNWCSYAGADMAGTSRLQYPATVRLVRFPCTGRMSPLVILKALGQGADGILVSGCHPGDCHYVHGNLVARRRFTLLRALLDFVGIDPRRLHFAWVSAAEGHKWARVVREVSAAVHAAGPAPRWRDEPAGKPRVALPPRPEQPRPELLEEERAARTEALRAAAADLLGSGGAAVVIGYTAGSLPGRLAPAFVTSPDGVAALEWGDGAVHNLTTHVAAARRRHGKVGLVVKRCDLPAVVGLIREGQLRREEVVLLGVPCAGVAVDGRPAEKCAACSGEVDPSCDVVVAGGGKVAASTDPRDQEIAHLESLSPLERWSFWQPQLQRCLRCYACRAVCPLCYCPQCIAEQHRPQWIPTSIDGAGNTAWNLIRAFHLAGRCTGCDECARACPADIRLDLLNRRLALEVERQFGSGLLPAERAALTEFRQDDPGEFFL